LLDLIRSSDYIDELYHVATGDDPKLVVAKLIELLDDAISSKDDDLKGQVEELEVANSSLNDTCDDLKGEVQELDESLKELRELFTKFSADVNNVVI